MGTAIVIGFGPGLSASVARRLKERGHDVVVASRDPARHRALADEIGARAVACRAAEPDDMAALFADFGGDIEVAVYNPSARVRGPVADLDPAAVRDAMLTTAYGAFLMAREAVPRMEGRANGPRGRGAMLFTGASAGVKGFANSSSFAMGKFALRGLCQSLARELHPKGIHIAHFVIDGGIGNPARPERVSASDAPHSMLDPDAIADSYMHVLDQHRSAWTWEIELRPWVERF